MHKKKRHVTPILALHRETGVASCGKADAGMLQEKK
jgi:hypothetical protein